MPLLAGAAAPRTCASLVVGVAWELGRGTGQALLLNQHAGAGRTGLVRSLTRLPWPSQPR